MKFSDIILESRYRLHDIRKVDGTIIEAATEDGIRWTSSLLCSIVKSALIEMSRTLIAYKLDNNIIYDMQTRILDATIKEGEHYSSLEFVTEDSFYKIINIQEDSNKSIYRHVEDEKFFDMAWQNHETDEIESIQRKVFTTVYDGTDKKSKVLVLPVSTGTIPCKVIAKCSLESLFSVTSEIDLPFINSSDLIFDFVLRIARQIEHSLTQVELLDKIITRKLGEMKIEQS